MFPEFINLSSKTWTGWNMSKGNEIHEKQKPPTVMSVLENLVQPSDIFLTAVTW